MVWVICIHTSRQNILKKKQPKTKKPELKKKGHPRVLHTCMLFEVKYGDYINAVNQGCILQPSGESHASGLHGIFTHEHIPTHMHIIKNNKKNELILGGLKQQS